MKVITQNGDVVDTHEIIMSGCEILGIPDSDINKRVLLGTYPDKRQTVEVYSDIACIGWADNHSQTYEMPSVR